MQLNEIIEGNTLQSISDKTRLSVENLEKLFAQDFGAFRKVQALGFISILEREYRADLSDLREACYTYFADGSMPESSGHPSESADQTPRNPSAISEMPMPRRYPSFIKPLLVGLVAIGLLYAAWQTYSNTKGDANASRTGEDVGFFASMIQRATGWIGGGEKNTTALQIEGDRAAFAIPSEEDKETFVIQKTDKTQAESDAGQGERKNTRPDEEAQSQPQPVPSTAAQEPRLEIDEAIASAPEENGTEEVPLSTEVPSVSQPQTASTTGETSSAATAAAVQLAEPTADKPVDKEAARKRAEEEAARQKAAEEKAMRERAARERAARERAAREEAARQKAARLKAARAKIVLLKPRKKVWMGIVDLVNMKRRVATSNATQTFDTNKGKWIVATGHGFIDYTEGPKKKALNDGKKHFLLIADGKVREISHEEFQQLNKSKVW